MTFARLSPVDHPRLHGRLTAAFAVTAALGLALSACTHATAHKAAAIDPVREATAEPTTHPAAKAGTPLGRFVAAVETKAPDVAVDRRDEEIEELGQAACSGLTSGESASRVAASLASYGVIGTDAPEVVTLARANLCQR